MQLLKNQQNHMKTHLFGILVVTLQEPEYHIAVLRLYCPPASAGDTKITALCFTERDLHISLFLWGVEEKNQ